MTTCDDVSGCNIPLCQLTEMAVTIKDLLIWHGLDLEIIARGGRLVKCTGEGVSRRRALRIDALGEAGTLLHNGRAITVTNKCEEVVVAFNIFLDIANGRDSSRVCRNATVIICCDRDQKVREKQ